MRRTIAILLLLTLSSFLSAPLLAAPSDPSSNLPACCKSNGRHRCMTRMKTQQKLVQASTYVAAPLEKCPYFPDNRLLIPTPTHFFASSSGGMFDAAFTSHPTCVAQTEARYRIAFDRSHQKRGPPASLYS